MIKTCIAGTAALLTFGLAAVGGTVVTIAAPANAETGTTSLRTAGAATVIEPDRNVVYLSAGVPIRASYRAPAPGSTGVPAALIIGGTGNVDRNGNAPGLVMNSYTWLADRLSALGIASIRYDKVGTGATGLGPYASDPSAMLGLGYDQLRIQPARDALAFLAHQPGIDPRRLIVIGHSEGAAVALALANNPGSAPAPAGLALIEPAYTHILDLISRQLVVQMQVAVQAGAMNATDAATLTAWMNAGIKQIRTGTPPFPATGPVPIPHATGFTALMQPAIESNVYGSDPSQMVLTHSFPTRYGKEFDAIDPTALAGAVRVPTLVTCGSKDLNTPCEAGQPAGTGVRTLAGAFRPDLAHLVELPDVVHIMRDVGDADPPGLAAEATYPFSPVLAKSFDTFMATFVPATPPLASPSARPTSLQAPSGKRLLIG
jgi:uncharacterized protein